MTSTRTRSGTPPARPAAPPDPLAPVRAELLARAHADAAAALTAADADAAAALDRARQEADAILAAARTEGRADAAALLATERTRARRRARAVVLAAQRTAYDELRARVLAAVLALRDDPGYGGWRDRLRAEARARLGPAARLDEPSDGGVIAMTGTRQASYTLSGLAGQVLERLGPEVEGLWLP